MVFCQWSAGLDDRRGLRRPGEPPIFLRLDADNITLLGPSLEVSAESRVNNVDPFRNGARKLNGVVPYLVLTWLADPR